VEVQRRKGGLPDTLAQDFVVVGGIPRPAGEIAGIRKVCRHSILLMLVHMGSIRGVEQMVRKGWKLPVGRPLDKVLLLEVAVRFALSSRAAGQLLEELAFSRLA
jgi:hypothetical protein